VPSGDWLITLILVALALGIDNLAVSVGIGVSGVKAAVRWRVALVFGLFEAGMPVLGMALGRSVSADLGSAAQWLGGGLFALVGLHQVIGWLRERGAQGTRAEDLNPAGSEREERGSPWEGAAAGSAREGSTPDSNALEGSVQEGSTLNDSAPKAPYGSWGTGRLLLSGLALSIDNLVVGFALGTYHVSIEVAALVIGVVSVAMSLAGLELGARIGTALGERGELAGGIVLFGIGIAIAVGLL
jgi:manganese efflux pump family protein